MSNVVPAIVNSWGNKSTFVSGGLPSTGSAVTTLSVFLDQTISAGHAILVIVGCRDRAANELYMTITDGSSNSYGLISAGYSNALDRTMPSVWMAANVVSLPAGSYVTITLAPVAGVTPAAYGISAYVLDITGLASASIVDGAQIASRAASGAALADLDSGSITVTQGNELLLAALTWDTVQYAQSVYGYPTDVRFQATPVGQFIMLGGVGSAEAFDCHVRYPGPPVTYDNYGGYLAVGYAPLSAGSGAYHALLSYYSGTPTPSATPQSGIALVALKGQLNRAPNAPIPGPRAGFDATTVARFTWVFSDPDRDDSQTHYELIITRDSDSAIIYDSGEVASSNQFLDLPANTLTNGVAYHWKVTTWDTAPTVGPYCTASPFNCAVAAIIAITVPLHDGDTVFALPLVVTWTYAGAVAENQYQVRILQAGVQVYTSGILNGTATSLSIAAPLVSGTTYQVELTAWDANGIQTATMLRTFLLQFPFPPVPTITAITNTIGGYIAVANTVPSPSGVQAPADHVDVYRRISGSSIWIRIAPGQPANSTYLDYGAVDETSHDYKVTAVSIMGATQDSNIATATLVIDGIWLHCVSDPVHTARNFLWDSGQRSDKTATLVSFLQFEGRVFQVAEVNAMQLTGSVTVDLEMQLDLYNPRGSSDVNALRAIFAKRDTICYRDHRSRKVYGFLPDLVIIDQRMKYSTTLVITETDFIEGDASPTSVGLALGTTVVTTTATALTTSTPCSQVEVQADPTNTANVRIGWAAGQTIVMAPGDVEILPVSNANLVYVVAASGTQQVNWLTT